jgi:acyl-homoserine-lactone acylase
MPVVLMRLSRVLYWLGLAMLTSACEQNDVRAGRGVEILRTEYGVPHVTAASLPQLGFGQGYVEAEDHVCLILDQVIRLRSQRARYFGAGEHDVFLQSDLEMLALGIQAAAAAGLKAQSRETREWLDGFVAGFNEYIIRKHGELPEPCADTAWQSSLTAEDVMARAIDISLLTERGLYPGLGAQPPGATSACAPRAKTTETVMPAERPASNGWALGSKLTESGHGMLLANPHLPYEGELRMHEVHLTLPGELDAYGAGLVGLPGIQIGFNQQLAWTHTTSPSIRTLLYALQTDPDDPTRYLWDGEYRAMDRHTVSIDVLRDGTVKSEDHTVYASVHGPIVAPAPLTWSAESAYAMSSASIDNWDGIRYLLDTMRATSLEEFEAAHDTRGAAWATTECATADGRALYLDSSRVPQLSADTIASWQAAQVTDPIVNTLAQSGIAVLDGTTHDTWWRIHSGPGQDLVPLENAPRLERDDYVANANESYWLTNASAPLHGYSPLYGSTERPLYPRTRMNLYLLSDPGGSGAAAENGRISLDDIQRAVLDDRGITALLLLPELVPRCRGLGHVTANGMDVDLSDACDTLAGWDGTQSESSVGAVLFREFLGAFATKDLFDAGALFDTAFAASDPVATPRALSTRAPDGIGVALAQATQRLAQAGVDIHAPLRDTQYVLWNNRRLALHGCSSREGCLNVLAYADGLDTTLAKKTTRGEPIDPYTGLSTDGYVANFGSTFVLAVELTAKAPKARAIMTYGQSSQAGSAHAADQVTVWQEGRLREVLFERQAIEQHKQSLLQF